MSALNEPPGPDERPSDNATLRLERRIQELAALHRTAQELEEDSGAPGGRLAEVLVEERRIIDSLAGMLERAEAEIENYQRQLRGLASELLLTEERGRREIANELHDHLGQTLAFVRMKALQFGGNAVFCGFEHDVEQIVTLLDQIIQYTRTLTCEISPPVLYELGLGPAIEWLADQFRRKQKLAVDADVDADSRAVPDQLRIMIFQCVRELLTNAAKHAQASQVQVRIRCRDGRVVAEVTDDGVGFDPEAVAVGRHDRFGLFSIRERVTYLGGRVEISSEAGAGTRIRLDVPTREGGAR